MLVVLTEFFSEMGKAAVEGTGCFSPTKIFFVMVSKELFSIMQHLGFEFFNVQLFSFLFSPLDSLI